MKDPNLRLVRCKQNLSDSKFHRMKSKIEIDGKKVNGWKKRACEKESEQVRKGKYMNV